LICFKKVGLMALNGTKFAIYIVKTTAGGKAMRTFSITTVLALVILISACNTTRLAGPGVFHDDIYFVPGKDRANVHEAFAPVPSLTSQEQREVNEALAQQVNEFMRSERAREQEDMRDFSGIQEEYLAMLGNEEYQTLDTILYYNEDTGYWVDGFRGSSFDRSYAERIIRFRPHTVRVPYFSPFFSEVVFFNHYDWNVYVDGGYAYVFPTWTNRWYDHYFVNRWFWPSSFSLGWHWGSPFHASGWWSGWGPVWGAGWGFGWSPHFAWSSWHSPFWHFHHPHFLHSPYFGYHPWHGTTPWQGTRGMRSGFQADTRANHPALRGSLSDGRGQGTSNIRAPRAGGVTSAPDGIDAREPRQARDGSSGTAATRSPRVAGGSQGDVRAATPRGTGQEAYSRTVPTRRSYTPSYRQPNDNSRPVYNRATHTRVVDRPRATQTTGTIQSRPAATGQIQERSVSNQVQRINRPATVTTQQQGTVRSAPAGTRQPAGVNFQRGSSTAPTRQPGHSTGVTSTPAPRVMTQPAQRSASPAIQSQPSRSTPSVSPAPRSSTPSFSSPSPSRSSSPAPSGGASSPSPRSSSGGRR